MTGLVTIQVPPSDLVDRMIILEIKLARIEDRVKNESVRSAYFILARAFHEQVEDRAAVARLMVELRVVNIALWDAEDAIRACEAAQDFGEDFVRVARSIYRNNDRRAEIKNSIDRLLGSKITDEKSLPDYTRK